MSPLLCCCCSSCARSSVKITESEHHVTEPPRIAEAQERQIILLLLQKLLHIAKMERPVLDQLCERYWNEWDRIRTNDPQNPNNFRALENICLSPRLSAVTSIIVLGLGNGGTYQEQVKNCNNRLDAYLEYSQKVFFTQIVVAKNLANLLTQRFRIGINIWAYDPQTTPYTWGSLQYLGIQTIQNNTTRDELRNYITPGSLVYDVTRSPHILRETVDFTWDNRHTPPAAVITGFFALAGGNNGMEVDA